MGLRRIAPLAVVAVLAGCGDDEVAVPTAEELAADLLTADDLVGEWSINTPPDGEAVAETGVVPDELQELLPRIEMCDAATAESKAAADSLRWMAFRQLDLAAEDPIEPPGDRSGHLVFVQEFLTAAPVADAEATFEALAAGMEACLGELPAGEEGPGLAVTMPTPDVGDESIGVLTTVEEAGGWAQWRLHQTLVRQGPVLAVVMVADIVAGEGTTPLYDQDAIDRFTTLALDKL